VRHFPTWIAVVVVLASSVWQAACTQHRKVASSVVEVADLSVAGQLAEGFYGIEDRRWRWTADRFSVMLGTPPGADDRGAYLQLKFFVPDEEIQKTGPMTLRSDVEEVALPPETISKGGFQTYSREVPLAALQSNLIKVEFSFDQPYVPGNGDARRLGAVVHKVWLTSK